MWKLLSALPQGLFQPGRGSHQRWQGFRYFCHFTIPPMFHNHVGVFSMLSNITPHPINPPNLDKMGNFRIILTVLWLAISCNRNRKTCNFSFWMINLKTLEVLIQARAGFLLKVADRIDARLDELAIAESRDQVFLFLFYFLFWSSFALFFSELMLTRDQMCLSMVLFCVFVLCLDYLHARTKPDNRFVCSCTRLFHVMLSWWVLTAWGLLANSFSKFRKRVVVYARWSACLMLVVDTFAKKKLNPRCVCCIFGHVFHLAGTPMNEIFRENQWTLPRRWTSPGPQ